MICLGARGRGLGLWVVSLLLTSGMTAVVTRADEPAARVLMLAGPPSHGYGSHEHYPGLMVLAESVKSVNAAVEVEVLTGWPDDSAKIDQADSVVIYCDGQKRHLAYPPQRREQLERLLKRGGGLVAIHYAVEMLNDASGDQWREMLGGHFEAHYSVNPGWLAEFTQFPKHPVANGLTPYGTSDEWYFNLRFAESGDLTPILQAVPPPRTMTRPDGSHSGNPAARKAVAEGVMQTMAWAYEPPGGGRSFGFTGGHYHWNWSEPNQLRLLTNAILWTAGLPTDSPQSGISPPTLQTLMQDQDEASPSEFGIIDIKNELDENSGAAASVGDSSTSVANFPTGGDESSTGGAESSTGGAESSTGGAESAIDAAIADTVKPLQHAMTPMLVGGEDPPLEIRVEYEWPPGDYFLAPGRHLYLVTASDEANSAAATTDGQSSVRWVNATLKGPAGLLPLSESLLVDTADDAVPTVFSEAPAEASGEVGTGGTIADSDSPSKRSIVVSPNQVLQFYIPEGYEQLLVDAVVESRGSASPARARFAVYADAPPIDMDAGSLDELLVAIAGGKRLPANAVAGIAMTDDLRLELMGSEPELRSLTNLDIDHRGRVWVIDVMNYRRLEGLRRAGDRILILEDTTGDGRLDEVKTYYQGNDINAAMGICILDNQVIISASPNIWQFTDLDGDDKPDRKVAIFSDTGDPQSDHAAHSFTFGPDGYLYWNFGNTGNAVRDTDGEIVTDIHGRRVVDNGKPFLGGMVFRCDVDGGNLEVLAHNFRNPWETTVDSFGTIWQSDNDDDGNRGCRMNYVMQHGNYGYRDELTGGTWRENRIGWERDIPERHWHLNDPGVVPNLYQTGQGSPAGIDVYEGDLFPARFAGSLLHCDPGPGEVRQFEVTPAGGGYTATMQSVAAIADDDWFRPVDVCTAPDGSVFVTDWYDSVVGAALQGDPERGRLFRMSPPGVAYRTPPQDFTTAQGCASALASPNRATRYMSWKRLMEFGQTAEPALVQMFDGDRATHRARALWALSNLPERGVMHCRRAAQDEDVNIRVTAIRALNQIVDNPAEILGLLADDPAPAVRRELALSLRYDPSDAMPMVWAELAMQLDASDRWMVEALGIGCHQRPDECFAAWMKRSDGDWRSPAAKQVVWRVRAAEAAKYLGALISDLATSSEETERYFRSLQYHAEEVQQSTLERVIGRLGEVDAAAVAQPEIDRRVVQCLVMLSGDQPLQTPSVRGSLTRHLNSRVGTAEYLRLVKRFRPDGVLPTLQSMVIDPADDTISLAALELILDISEAPSVREGFGSLSADNATRLATLLGVRGGEIVQPILQSMLLQKDQAYGVRSACVRGLAKNVMGQQRLISIAKESQLPDEVSLLTSGLLARSEDASVRGDAEKVLPRPESQDEVPLPPLDVLTTLDGDANRGQLLFRGEATCSRCHVVQEYGKEVGPNLSLIGAKLSAEAMYAAILDPSAGISHNYENHIALLEDGRIVNGLLIAESNDRIVLRNAEAIDIEIDPEELVQMKKSEKSIMPEGLHRTMGRQGLVDVVTYMRTLGRANPASRGE